MKAWRAAASGGNQNGHGMPHARSQRVEELADAGRWDEPVRPAGVENFCPALTVRATDRRRADIPRLPGADRRAADRLAAGGIIDRNITCDRVQHET